MGSNFIVYIIKDQGVPFYVGKGASVDRMYWHEKYAKGEVSLGYGLKKDYNPRKTRKIQKMIREGRIPEYEWIDFEFEIDAFNKEIDLIKQYGRKNIDPGGILMNLTVGGVGGNTIQHLTDEQREILKNKKSIIAKNRPAEAIEKIRQSSLGRTHSAKTRRKMSKSKSGTNNPMYGKISPNKGKPASGLNAKGIRKASNAIKIDQIDLNGNVIKTWSSIKEIFTFYFIGEKAIRNIISKQTLFDNSYWVKNIH